MGPFGASVLQWAASNGRVETVKLLVGYGAEVNARVTAAQPRCPWHARMDMEKSCAYFWLQGPSNVEAVGTIRRGPVGRTNSMCVE